MNDETMPPGKVPWDRLSGKIRMKLPPEVLLGPSLGEDAALVRMGGEVWAVASDPVTYASRDAGRLSVIVNANDVAVRGARPLFFTAVVLLAEGEGNLKEAETLLAGIRDTCEAMGIALIGGHTEVTPGLRHTVVAGTMLGRVEERPILTGGLRIGDWVGMTKWAGLEGTAVLMAEKGEILRKILGEEAFIAAEALLDGEWISVVPEALAAASLPQVTALHDVTEGGVGEALHEMARASGVRLRVFQERIPLLPFTERLCRHLEIHPFGLLGSGALLVGCAEEGKPALEGLMEKGDIPFAWIGKAEKREGEAGATLPRFERDEILKVPSLPGERTGKE